MDNHARKPRLRLQINHRLDWLAKAARAGQFVASQSIEAPVLRRDQQFVSRLRMSDESLFIAFLIFEFLIQIDMPLCGPDPALLRKDDGDRLFLDHRIHAEFNRRRGFLDPRAAAAKFGILGIILAQSFEVAFQPRALARG